MTAVVAFDQLFTPDNPARRAVWVLPLAILLVLLALLGFGGMLRAPLTQAPPPPPIRAEIYELPGKIGPKPRAESPAMTRAAPKPAQPAPAPPKEPAKTVPAPEVPKPVPPAVVHTAPPTPAAPPAEKAPEKANVSTKSAERRSEIVERAKPRPKPAETKAPPKAAEAEPPQHLSWAQLNAQVNDAVAATVDRPAMDRIRDPNSLVAHYYLASVLSKLERVGQLTYQASMVGQAAVAIVIGPEGELLDLQLTGPSGQPRIDDYAQQIVRMSVPFAPFPADLERETTRLRIVVHMDFQGYREVNAN